MREKIIMLIAQLEMTCRWIYCDLAGHGETVKTWVFELDDPRFRGFFNRCERCWRYVA